jgi:hypothetical protein
MAKLLVLGGKTPKEFMSFGNFYPNETKNHLGNIHQMAKLLVLGEKNPYEVFLLSPNGKPK